MLRFEVARSLPVPFTFVARAENTIRGRTVSTTRSNKLRAFEKAFRRVGAGFSAALVSSKTAGRAPGNNATST